MQRRRLFRQVHGRSLPLLRPQTFTEKVAWRITNDRRPLLAHTCDKLAMKAHAERVAPDLVRVPRTLWEGTDLHELAGADLQGPWVLKPNHSSQKVVFGHGRPDRARVAELVQQTQGWLEDRHWRETGEWAYRFARPALIVEELIGTPGQVPDDYKVVVFDGVPRLVQVHSGRLEEHTVRMYTPEWEPVTLRWEWALGRDVPPPARLDDMLRAAAALAEGFDMLRVDFYEEGGVLWFGELTPYPGSGLSRLDPVLDEWMGAWWTLPGRTPRPAPASSPEQAPTAVAA